jgi:SAM-dependent methyltransferase
MPDRGDRGAVHELTRRIAAEVEDSPWWFAARRKLLSQIIRKLRLPPEAAVLALGTAMGEHLRMLEHLGCRNTTGLDKYETAIRYRGEQAVDTIEAGEVCDLPFEDERFALVLATDIVAHVVDDGRALSEIRRVLSPGGSAVLVVPAFEALRGRQDDTSQPRHRYCKRQLEERLRAAGLEDVDVFYFNYLLWFPLWLARQRVGRLRQTVCNERPVPSSWLDHVLTAVVTLDVHTARWVRAPFGVSLLAIARSGRRAGVGVPLRVDTPIALVRPHSAAAGAYRGTI